MRNSENLSAGGRIRLALVMSLSTKILLRRYGQTTNTSCLMVVARIPVLRIRRT
jgi:hypothetical protein